MTSDSNPNPAEIFVNSLVKTTAAGLTPWHVLDGNSLTARAGIFEAVITRQQNPGPLRLTTVIFTLTAEPDHRFQTDCEAFPQLHDLADMAAENARDRRHALLAIAHELYGDVPAREIPAVHQDPDGRYTLLDAAAHATSSGRLEWTRLDDYDRSTNTAAGPLASTLQTDLTGPRQPDPRQTKAMFTVTQQGQPLATVTETAERSRRGYPLLLLLSAINEQKERRRQQLLPELQQVTGDDEVDEILRSFFGSII